MDNEVATDTGRQNNCYLWITGLIKMSEKDFDQINNDKDPPGNWVEKITGVRTVGNAYFQLDESLGEAKADVHYRAFIRCKPGGS